MAKNPGRGNKIFRRNTIPNVVGQNITTARSTLASLGYSHATTTENTGDSGLSDKVKAQDKVGDAQVGSTVNLVQYTFSFAPFGAFGFTPFGFTPFGFTPFGFTPFGFTPWGGPSNCVHEDTLIRTPNGNVAAKDIKVNDAVLTINIEEIPLQGLDSGDLPWQNIAIPTLTSLGTLETLITKTEESTVQEVVWFNGESESKFSLKQPMLVKGDPFYLFVESGLVKVGDVLIKVASDGSVIEVPVTSIDTDDSSHKVYAFGCEPQDWFVAGNYLVHNK